MNKVCEPIHVVGISTITSNEAAFKQNTIGDLWSDFLKNPIKDQLADVSSSSIFAVYSDYENGYDGKYKITIGYAVNHVSNIPNGLTTVIIPEGKYKTFKSKSPSPEDIVGLWKSILANIP